MAEDGKEHRDMETTSRRGKRFLCSHLVCSHPVLQSSWKLQLRTGLAALGRRR